MDILRVPPSPALRQWSHQHGFSPELIARWGAFYGERELPGLVKAMKSPPRTFLRTNPLRGDEHETIRRLKERGVVLEPSGLAATWRVVESPFSVGATEEYLLGRYQLQDVSSALAPYALDPQPGDVIADLCAAPGGKTIQMAALTGDRAAIFAFDPDADRVRGLESNLQRCGVAGAAVYAQTAQQAERLGLTFDKILLDAPCTGEGVVSRDPNRRTGQLQEFASCAIAQTELMGVAARLLRPGGVLVYSTCTLAPEENEAQVDDALRAHGLTMEPLPRILQGLRLNGEPLSPGLVTAGPARFDESLRLAAHALPHKHGCLGFFIARMRKGAA